MKLAASYVRVSTEEQALHGYSIQAQREAIAAYAEAHGYKIIREYADEGVSGKKPYTKRPALSRFMEDIQSGLKPDALLFTKLDRLFRSVKHYYKAAEVLDANGVPWVAVHEDFETETANGRLKVNLMLSIAEHEADRTGERIRAVNESKIRHGQVITGKVPLGFMIDNHRLVHKPDEVEAAKALFCEYERLKSVSGAVRALEERFGVVRSVNWAKAELRNPVYKGQYRDNPNYCEPLIAPADFDRVQTLLETRCVRRNQSNRLYIFSGLLVCAECGQKMTGMRNGRGTNYYRCAFNNKYPQRCSHRKHISEDALEKWLLLNIKSELDAAAYRIRVEYEQARQTIPDKSGIIRKLDRIKAAYLSEAIPLEVFRQEYESLQAQLSEIERMEREWPVTPDFDRARERLETLDTAYQGMDRQEKQTFWRQIVKKIIVDGENNCTVYFL